MTTDERRYKFHPMYYNFIAKRIREQFDMGSNDETAVNKVMSMTNRAVLSDLALACAKRFKEDNPEFDAVKFLDQCSPDSEMYPMGELWEDGES